MRDILAACGSVNREQGHQASPLQRLFADGEPVLHDSGSGWVRFGSERLRDTYREPSRATLRPRGD